MRFAPWLLAAACAATAAMAQESVEHPPKRFGVMPFWFWNDDLSERELLRQIAEMDARGVGGLVIHPRVGLPRSIGWMSEPMLAFMKLAVGEAARGAD